MMESMACIFLRALTPSIIELSWLGNFIQFVGQAIKRNEYYWKNF
jgi:hypothetical protein